MMCYDGLPMVVEMARLNMRLALYVHTLAPGSLPVQPSLTISTAESCKLETDVRLCQHPSFSCSLFDHYGGVVTPALMRCEVFILPHCQFPYFSWCICPSLRFKSLVKILKSWLAYLGSHVGYLHKTVLLYVVKNCSTRNHVNSYQDNNANLVKTLFPYVQHWLPRRRSLTWVKRNVKNNRMRFLILPRQETFSESL